MESPPPSPSFPLEADKLPRLQVDRESVKWWKQQARLEIAALLQDRESWYYKGRDATSVCALRPVYNNHGVRGYAESSQSPKRSAYFGEGVLNVSLEDIAYALYCDESADQRTLATNLYRVNFLDGAVLDVFERKTAEDPFRFAGTKWVAYTIPPGLVKPQELIYFEFSCKTRDIDGHVVLVQYIMCPSLVPEQLEHPVAADLARAHMNQITTYRSLEDGTHCQTTGWFESSRSVPEWVVGKSLRQLFDNMVHLIGLADARAIAKLGAASALSTARACYLCNKKFGVLHKRRNCRSCGQSICSKCTIKLKVLGNDGLQERPSLTQPSKLNASRALKFVDNSYCLPCVLQAREQRPESGSFLNTSPSYSSAEEEGYSAAAPSSLDEYCGDIDIDLLDLHDSAAYVEVFSRAHRIEQRDRSVRQRVPSREPNRTARSGGIGAVRARRKVTLPVEESLSRADAVAQEQQRHKSRRHAVRRATSVPIQDTDRVRGGVNEREMHSASADRQHVESAPRSAAQVQQEQPPPPMPASFNKLTQSIAAQEALLHSIQNERQRLHSQQQRWRRQRRQSLDLRNYGDDDNDGTGRRFEVLSDLD